MRVALLSTEKSPLFIKTLQGYGLRVERGNAEKVETLSRNTTDLVYMVPFSWLEDPRWTQIRVHLARSSRYYIVEGAGLDTRQIMTAARDGAYDVVDEGDAEERVLEALEKAANAQALWWQLYGAAEDVGEQILVGRSSLLKAVRESIQRIGPTKATILVLGESGTGKERVAEAIHKAYGGGEMIAVNCAAIPSELMESELFGVEKGAFTGANRDKPGLVEEAKDGILFLDEVGELEISLQPKLLRFLENGVARRVGSTKDYHSTARIISATNRDLKRDSERGRFRLDLYYRLSEVVLNLPPLRQRMEDIPDLAPVFLRRAAERLGKNFEILEPELISKFQHYDWPGNVRELKQVVDRLAIHYDGPVMRADWWENPETEERGLYEGSAQGGGAFPGQPLPSRGRSHAPFPAHGGGGFPYGEAGWGGGYPGMPTPGWDGGSRAGGGPQERSGRPLNRKEKQKLAAKLIKESDGDLTWVAAQLGVHPTTLYRWRKCGKV